MTPFEELGLSQPLLNAISDLGFEKPSEVQEKAIPVLLENETDLVALAQTGTGKTAAFGFPMIQKIQADSRTTQGLILSPTRELCLQITKELQLYSKYVKGLRTVAIYGGASITEQARQIKKGAQRAAATTPTGYRFEKAFWPIMSALKTNNAPIKPDKKIGERPAPSKVRPIVPAMKATKGTGPVAAFAKAMRPTADTDTSTRLR